MTYDKYKRYIQKIYSYNPQLSIIERLDEMEAVLAFDPVEQRIYFAYLGTVSVFPYESIKDVDYSLDSEYHESGSLGGTLFWGALLGDFGALLGSGLLSPGHSKDYFVLKIKRYGKDDWNLRFRYRESYDDLLEDYRIIQKALEKIIAVNMAKNERDPYETTIIVDGCKVPPPETYIREYTKSEKRQLAKFGKSKPIPQPTNGQWFILIGICCAIYLVILCFVAKSFYEKQMAKQQIPESETVAMMTSYEEAEPVFEEEVPTEENPVEEAAETETLQTYVIQKGDTLSFIAKKLNTTVDELLSMNPRIEDKNKIYPGEVIYY